MKSAYLEANRCNYECWANRKKWSTGFRQACLFEIAFFDAAFRRDLSPSIGPTHPSLNCGVPVGLNSAQEPDSMRIPRSQFPAVIPPSPDSSRFVFQEEEKTSRVNRVLQLSSGVSIDSNRDNSGQESIATILDVGPTVEVDPGITDQSEYPPAANGDLWNQSLQGLQSTTCTPSASFPTSSIYHCWPLIETILRIIDDASFFLSSLDLCYLLLVYGVTYLPEILEFCKFRFALCFEDPIIWWPWEPPLARGRCREYWNCVCGSDILQRVFFHLSNFCR